MKTTPIVLVPGFWLGASAWGEVAAALRAVVCTGYTSEQYKDAAKEGQAWLGGLAELRNVIYVDMPTSHWPMWSRPQELARIISDIARA